MILYIGTLRSLCVILALARASAETAPLRHHQPNACLPKLLLNSLLSPIHNLLSPSTSAALTSSRFSALPTVDLREQYYSGRPILNSPRPVITIESLRFHGPHSAVFRTVAGFPKGTPEMRQVTLWNWIEAMVDHPAVAGIFDLFFDFGGFEVFFACYVEIGGEPVAVEHRRG